MLRLPPEKRWVGEKQKEGREKVILWALSPLILLFLLGFAYIINEEIFTGTMA